jgi:cytochrome c553
MKTLFGAAVASVFLSGAAMAQPALVAQGDYIVNAVGGCNDCHSPMGPNGPIPGRQLTGAQLGFAPIAPVPGWAPVAPPIAGLPAGYTEAQLATFLQTGVKPDGKTAGPPMPAFRMKPEDARAVAAYLKSLRPN